METTCMGKVIVPAKIENISDLYEVDKGQRQPNAIRCIEVPDALVEATSIDGAGFFGIYRHVMFPLSLPGFVVVIIWQFTQIWNEFLFAVTLSKPDSQPITVALAQLAGGEAVKWNLPMAGALLAALPTLLVYVIFGRFFIRGLLSGSVKG